MNVTYFAHDMSDFAVRRRVAMLLAGGAKVSLFGFTRAESAVTDVEGAPAVVFGRTYDGKLYHRALSALASIFKLGRYRKTSRGLRCRDRTKPRDARRRMGGARALRAKSAADL